MRGTIGKLLVTLTTLACVTLGAAGCGSDATAEGRPQDEGGGSGLLSTLFGFETVRVPAGTELTVTFLDPVWSGTSQTGDTFRARVAAPVTAEGREAVPAGAVVIGSVREATAGKKIGGRASIALDFHTVELPGGETAAIRASFAAEGKSETKRDATAIGAGTAAGALLGQILGGDSEGTVAGAVVGGAAGTAAAFSTKGRDIGFAAGRSLVLRLEAPAEIPVSG